MGEDESLVYIYEGEKLSLGNLAYMLQSQIEQYNESAYNEIDVDEMWLVIYSLILLAQDSEQPNEFAQIMTILLYALDGRRGSRSVEIMNMHNAYEQNDLEICREVVIRGIEAGRKSDIKDSKKEFISLSQENKEQNIADIFGMLIEELTAYGLAEENYQQLLEDFAGILQQWRELEVPKTKIAGSYELVHELMEKCCKHKAYHTAVRLSGLLFAADRTKKKEHLSRTLYLLGKVTYELGYREVSKRCFLFVDEDANGQCWQVGDEKYKEILQQETRLELSEEILELQKNIDARVESGDIPRMYTREEVLLHRKKKFDIPFVSMEPVVKERKSQGEKAINTYEKSANTTSEERIQAIDAAFAIFTEAPEVYPEAAYLYFKKGNIYLDKGDFETAYDCFKKAYNCKDGKRNGMVLLGLAIVLSQMGRMKESTAYLFRTYILCGKDFVVDKVGEEPWKMVEQYL